MHPGGELVLMEYAGKDATEVFYGLHRHQDLLRFKNKLAIGTIIGESSTIKANQFGSFSKILYAEHPQVQGFKGVYYTDKHLQYRSHVRKFIDEHFYADALACEASGGILC